MKTSKKVPKKAQITLFVILAVIIVAGIALVLVLRAPGQLPAKLQPVENSFLSCINNIAVEGASALGEQGGYIYVPDAELGNEYAPFGSQLNFFSSQMPYWFYVSPKNIIKEQVPTIKNMQDNLNEYVQSRIDECSFDAFAEQGYNIGLGSEGETAKVESVIHNKDISLKVDYPLTITFEDTTKRVTSHSSKIESNLGALYTLAKEIYSKEKQESFLENYAIDTITLNAPTTGAEVSCTPKIWMKGEIESKIKNSLQDNTQFIKLKGSYYTLQDANKKYFVYDTGKNINQRVNFFYSSLFPTKFEAWPSDNDIMKAEPVGMQEGMGALGLCYVPYHFVYSLSYPVIVQVFDEKDNLFQFPVVVVVDKNQPKQADISGEIPEQYEGEMCKNKAEDITIYTKNPRGEAVEADVQYKCSSTICNVGKTKISGGDAVLEAKFPQCVNGFVITSSENYAKTKTQLSTNEPSSSEIIMYPYHDLDIHLKNVQVEENESLLLSFVSDDYTTSIIYPSQKQLKLVEGNYEVSARLFRKGTLKLDSANVRKCVNVPETGVKGFFGMQREECYDLTLPAQNLDQLIAGGGKASFSVLEGELEQAKQIDIELPLFESPKTVIEMQDSYALLETSIIQLSVS